MNRTVPELNVPLLEATMGAILADPSSWDQSYYGLNTDPDCGTTMCFAGHAVTLAGAQLNWGNGHNPFVSTCTLPDGTERPVSLYAAEVLGLDWEDEAIPLFHNFTKDPDELHRHVKDLIESRQGALA